MLSLTTEYALRAMVCVANLERDRSITSEDIAAWSKVPRDYLSKILRDLVVAGLIRSQRGPNGGFSLARPAPEISILDVVNAVDPIQRITKCPLGNPLHVQLCPLHRRIDDAIGMIEREFRGTHLAEVLETNRKAAGACRVLANPTVHGVSPPPEA